MAGSASALRRSGGRGGGLRAGGGSSGLERAGNGHALGWQDDAGVGDRVAGRSSVGAGVLGNGRVGGSRVSLGGRVAVGGLSSGVSG